MLLSFETGTFFSSFQAVAMGQTGWFVQTENRSFRYKSIRHKLNEWKCTKILFNFKCSLRVNKKNILDEYRRSLIKPSTGNYLHLEWIDLYRKDLYQNDQYSMNVANVVMTSST